MEISMKVNVKVPQTPNFIILSNGEGSLPVEDFTDAELKTIGEAWTKDIIAKAKGRRSQAQVKP